jgi:hypothetical protein
MTRSALLLRCATEEADRIRIEANKRHRTISRYVVDISVRAVAEDNHKFSNPSRRSIAGRRTAVLVRCAVAEAEQIREAARRHAIPINAFVLQALKRAWEGYERLSVDGSGSPAHYSASSVR